MKTYALINSGLVYEIIPPEVYDEEDPSWKEGDASRIGHEIPIELRLHPDFVANIVDITDESPVPEQNWTYRDGVFAAPVVHQPTPADILAENTRYRDTLLTAATLAIDPLQDAVDLEDATAGEIAMLKKWKQYRVAVNRVDLMIRNPVWPTAPTGI